MVVAKCTSHSLQLERPVLHGQVHSTQPPSKCSRINALSKLQITGWLLAHVAALASGKRTLMKGWWWQADPENNLASCMMTITIYKTPLAVASSRNRNVFTLEAHLASIVLYLRLSLSHIRQWYISLSLFLNMARMVQTHNMTTENNNRLLCLFILGHN